MSGVLTGIRAELSAALEAAGISVRESASTGHMSPPAAIVTPGPEWIVANAQLGGTLHARIQVSVTFLVGKQAAGASLAALEDLVELALPVLAPQKWLISTIGEPFALTIAGTEYLAASATLTRAAVI